MLVSFPRCKVTVDIANLAFASGIAGWAAWYCWDAWHANAAVENLILILPVSGIAIVLYLFVAAGSIKRVSSLEGEVSPPQATDTRKTAIKITGAMVLLAGFVIVGPLVGFDIASFAYMLLMMAFLGERRILVLLLFPLLFSVAVVYCFGTLLATPLPVLILRGQY